MTPTDAKDETPRPKQLDWAIAVIESDAEGDAIGIAAKIVLRELRAAQTENERLARERDEAQALYHDWLARALAAEAALSAKQAKIDALMLEYCPNEMTPEQLEEWGKHQRPAKEEL